MARRSAGQSALTRVVRVLEAFEPETPVLTASELARRAGLAAPTTYRIVGELVEMGLLERDAQGVRIGVRLWEIAASAPRASELREAARPFMEDVHATTRQHTHLAVPDARDAVFVERISERDAVINLSKVGSRMPLHASSSGLVLLAYADRDLQEAVLTAPMQRFTDHTPVDPKQTRSLLASIRQSGYVVCDGFVHPDAMGIAVPVRGAHGDVVAALSVVIPSTEAQPMIHVPVLRAAARGIGRATGARNHHE